MNFNIANMNSMLRIWTLILRIWTSMLRMRTMMLRIWTWIANMNLNVANANLNVANQWTWILADIWRHTYTAYQNMYDINCLYITSKYEKVGVLPIRINPYRIGSIPSFSYFDLYLYTAYAGYAAHYFTYAWYIYVTRSSTRSSYEKWNAQEKCRSCGQHGDD